MFLNHLYGGVDEPEQKIIDVFSARGPICLGSSHTRWSRAAGARV